MQRVAVPCFNCEYRDKNKTIFLKGMNSIDLHIDPQIHKSTNPFINIEVYQSVDFPIRRKAVVCDWWISICFVCFCVSFTL